MIKYIQKLLKKQRLLRKYKPNDEDLLNHIHLDKSLGWKHPAVLLSLNYLTCKRRCYNRLKKL